MSWDVEGNDFGYTVQQLRDDVNDLLEVVERLPPRFVGVDRELDSVRSTLREVEARSVEVDAAGRRMAAALKRLGARVEWLERNIRLQTELPEAELDAAGPEEHQLAEVAEGGRRAAAELLDAPALSALRAAIEAHRDAVRSRTAHRDAAVEACRVLAVGDPTTGAHQAAIGAFREAVAGQEEAGARIGELAGAAERAAARLAADATHRDAVTGTVQAGERAARELTELLRTRIADAVGEGALLPTWFTAVLGPIPPAQDTRNWMDAATDVLAYRVTYLITDPVLALGTPPEPEARPWRQAAYQDLVRRLRTLSLAE
jgi:hypothetical protein